MQPGLLFLQGLAVLLPASLTGYLLIISALAAERLFARLVQPFIPGDRYIPGLGILAGVLVIFGVGLLMHFLVVARLFRWAEGLVERVPVVKSVYSMTKDFVQYFARAKAGGFNQVVMFTLPGQNLRMLGFVTRQTFADLPAGIGDADTVAVYLPMSYQIGGFTVYVPRASIQPVEMSMEDAMRFALTAGVSRVSAPHASPKQPPQQ
ncbi:MAG: DUF502 domain-containing protein [Lentisphaerae bacterium]|nr:DUF502 domain-containing protein [Lentisphaerota bacterium]